MPKYELVKENKTLMNATQNLTHGTRPDCWDHVAYYETYKEAKRALKDATDCRHQVRDNTGHVLLWSGDVI